MNEAASERADQALTQYIKGGRTLVDIGTEFAHLRRERDLSQQDLTQRAWLPLETVQAIESGRRLPTKQEFALLARGLELTPDRLVGPVLRHTASGLGALRSAELLSPGYCRPDGRL